VTLTMIKPLCISLGLLLSATAALAAGTDGVYENTAPDGSVELSNIPATDNQEPLIAAPQPAAATSASANPADTPAIDQPKDLRQQYRDRMLQGANADGSPTTAANPAISRRYKMMDRDTYRATVLGITSAQSASR
jgi:hypothetical protein